MNDFIFISLPHVSFDRAVELKMTPQTLQRNLLKIRSRTLPKPPDNVMEIISTFTDEGVKDFFGLTIREDKEKRTPFYRFGFHSGEFEFAIFSSNDIISLIKANISTDMRDYYMDATFKVWEFLSAINLGD